MIRKVFFSGLIILTFSCFGYSQKADTLTVPQAVKNRMLAQFPQTMDIPVKWEKAGANYKGTLTVMDQPATMVVDPTGKMLWMEYRQLESYLPQVVKDSLKKHFLDVKVLDVYKMVNDQGKVSYRTTIQHTSTTLINENGTAVKK